MKWIYTMVENGSYQIFKTMYELTLKNKNKSFKFDSREFNITTAKHICILGDKAQEEYDKYIDNQAERYYETKAEIARGK